MTSRLILARPNRSRQRNSALRTAALPLDRPAAQLPRFVRRSALAVRSYRLLSPIHWETLPERDLSRNYGQSTVPYACYTAAYLLKLDQHWTHMSNLRRKLVENPSLCWLLGFHIPCRLGSPNSIQANAALPTQRHLTRMLQQLPNAYLQLLLDQTVCLLHSELADVAPDFGQTISLDTKHVIAWVKENNHKAYVKDRYDKNKQPAGDPDCRLGCKRRRNQRTSKEPPPTPLTDPVSASTVQVGEFYWGYGSGVVATKAPGWGEFVLAELTQPFNCSDVSYFFPLMADTERRLGFRPRFGAFDAAFDPVARPTGLTVPGTSMNSFTTTMKKVVLPRFPSPKKGATSVPLAPMACLSARLGCPCPSSSPLWSAKGYWCLIKRAVTPAPSSFPNQPAKPVPLMTLTPPRAAAPPPLPPASALASATSLIATARPTNRSTSSAPPPNVSTPRPWHWASNSPNCATARPSPTSTP
jgi:hypothetical protein